MLITHEQAKPCAGVRALLVAEHAVLLTALADNEAALAQLPDASESLTEGIDLTRRIEQLHETKSIAQVRRILQDESPHAIILRSPAHNHLRHWLALHREVIRELFGRTALNSFSRAVDATMVSYRGPHNAIEAYIAEHIQSNSSNQQFLVIDEPEKFYMRLLRDEPDFGPRSAVALLSIATMQNVATKT